MPVSTLRDVTLWIVVKAVSVQMLKFNPTCSLFSKVWTNALSQMADAHRSATIWLLDSNAHASLALCCKITENPALVCSL